MVLVVSCTIYQEWLTVPCGDGDQVVTKLLKQCVYDLTPRVGFWLLLPARGEQASRASARAIARTPV